MFKSKRDYSSTLTDNKSVTKPNLDDGNVYFQQNLEWLGKF